MTKRANYQSIARDSLKALMDFEKTIEKTELDKSIIDLVKIRASMLNGCVFCLDMHTKEAKSHNERELRLYHLSVFAESPLFSEKEKAALYWTDRLTQLDSHGIDEETYQEVAQHFSEKELVDLTMAISSINAWNRLGVAFQPEPGSLDKFMKLDKLGLN